MVYLFAFLCPLICMCMIMPWLISLAGKINFVDIPTSRKNHKRPVALVGGIAMFFVFSLSLLAFAGFGDTKLIAVLLGAFLILCIGLVDDFYKTRKKEFAVLPRMLIQLAAAILVFAAGIRFTGITNPVTETYISFPAWLQFALTIIWIFGLTTVINWCDGMDGLAGILSLVAAITFFIAACYKDQPDSALLAVILIGCVLGFLKFNLFNARIFMGDSGANFLGFMLAVISLHGAFKQATVVSMFIPVLALGVPIFDNIFVVMKRFITLRPIYKADAAQIHHRLLKAGLKPNQVLMFIFLITVCLNITSIILLLLNL